MNIITIDCGASFIKGAAFGNNKIVKQLQKHAPAVPVEEDILHPVQIKNLISLVEQMILELADGETEIGLCISNEMHGFILCYEDGTPFTDYISWQKEYGKIQIEGVSAFDKLNSDEYAEDILYAGMALRAGLPSCNLGYLSRKGMLKTAGNKLCLHTLGDYILKVLSEKDVKCHPTNAAASGLYDLRTQGWNRRLIHAAGAGNILFPEIGEEGFVFTFRSLQVHALPAVGDQQAALLGAGLKKGDMLSFNLGTGAQVSKVVEEPECAEGYQIRPYFSKMYLKTIPHLPSGRALNVYIRFFKDVLKQFQIELSEDEIWSCLLKAERNCKETMLQCDMSFFENPVTDHVAGSITNIGEYALDTGNLMQGIFRQMGENFIWAADIVEPHPQMVKKIIFSGGVARKIERIREYILKHYNSDTEVAIASDETLWGLYQYWKCGMRGDV